MSKHEEILKLNNIKLWKLQEQYNWVFAILSGFSFGYILWDIISR